MASALIARSLIVVFGLLYPSYMSYKAVKTRSVQAYVKWMMYWIVFALFYNVETVTDLVLSWFPLYYELKVIFVFWLLSPQTQGSEIIYKLYVHPHLNKHEEELDQVWDKMKDHGYSALVNVGAQSLNMALQGAMKGQTALVERINQRERRDSTDSLKISEVLDDQHFESEYQDFQLEEIPTLTPQNASPKVTSLSSLHRHSCHEPQPLPEPPFMRKARPAYQYQNDRPDARLRRQSSHSSIMTTSLANAPATREQFYRSFEESSQRTPSPLQFDAKEYRRKRLSENVRERQYDRCGSSQSLSRQTSLELNEERLSFSTKSGTIPKAVGNIKKRTEVDNTDSNFSKFKASKEFRQSHKVKNTPRGKRTVTAQTDDNQKELEEEIQTIKYTRSEATLRYRTKKISDIKNNKIQSPFISML